MCVNGTGHYVEKADYDRLLVENAKLVKALADWMACASYLVRQLKIANDMIGNYTYQLSPNGRRATDKALKTFEELSG